MLEMWSIGVYPIQVGVEGKVAEGLPRRLVALDLDGVHADGRVVPDGRGGHHGDAVHGAVTQLAAVLQTEGREQRQLLSLTNESVSLI